MTAWGSAQTVARLSPATLSIRWQVGAAGRHHACAKVSSKRLKDVVCQLRVALLLLLLLQFGFPQGVLLLQSNRGGTWQEEALAFKDPLAVRDPEVKTLLQKAAELKKAKAAGVTRELPLKDQRAKLVALIRKLSQDGRSRQTAGTDDGDLQ
eukprot:5971151-Amphidinium_carterae.1